MNNAGFGTFGKFAELPIEREEQEILLNVVAVTRLTHAALPGMVERREGGVINVASIAAYQPTPGNATYGATKAFVSSFTQAVHEELKGTGVKCMVLSPGFTRTEFQERAGIDSARCPTSSGRRRKWSCGTRCAPSTRAGRCASPERSTPRRPRSRR